MKPLTLMATTALTLSLTIGSAGAYKLALVDATTQGRTHYVIAGGSNTSGLLSALQDTGNQALIGPTGSPLELMIYSSTADFTQGLINGDFDGFVNDMVATYEQNFDQEAIDFILAGGDMIAFADGTFYNGIACDLGLCSGNSSYTGGTTVTLSGALASGPFGTVSSIPMHFPNEVLGVTAAGGTVLGTLPGNEPGMVFFAENQYAAGAGTMLIFPDIDILDPQNSGAAFDANNDPTTDGGIVLMNGFALLAQDEGIDPDIPAPAAGALLLAGLGGLLARRR